MSPIDTKSIHTIGVFKSMLAKNTYTDFLTVKSPWLPSIPVYPFDLSASMMPLANPWR